MATAGRLAFRGAPAPDQQQQQQHLYTHQAAYPMQAALSHPTTPPQYPRSGAEHLDAAKGGSADVRRPRAARAFVLVVGTVLVALVVIVPVSNSLLLVWDPTFVFFVGPNLPLWTVALCLLAVVLYPLVVRLFFAFAREDAQNGDSLVLVMSTIVSALGLGLLLISAPMRVESKTAYLDIFNNCAFSSTTRDLHEYSAMLQGIRNSPDCRSQESVETCKGFKESQPYTSLLKDMELRYKCAGFCSGNVSALLGTAALTESEPRHVKSMAMPQVRTSGSLAKALSRHLADARQVEASEEASLLATPEWSELDVGRRRPNGSPTLFSTANYQASCDSLAAWELQFHGEGTAAIFYVEGVFLLLCTAVAGVLKVLVSSVFLGICGFSPRGDTPRVDGGAALARKQRPYQTM